LPSVGLLAAAPPFAAAPSLSIPDPTPIWRRRSMSNPHGSFIWYELMSNDPDAAKAFHDDVVGWNIGPKPVDEMDYRMIAAPDGQVGGVLHLTDEMRKHGRWTWERWASTRSSSTRVPVSAR
jgi:hypothetical protein